MLHLLMFVLLAGLQPALAHAHSCAPGLDNFMFPKPRRTNAAILGHPQVRALGTPWEFQSLSLASVPLSAFTVRNPQEFSDANLPNVRRMLIKAPGLYYAIPPGFEAARPTLQQIFDFEHALNPVADDQFAYLTIDSAEVEAGQTHGPSGFRLEGFHSASRRGEAIDHSYVVSDTLPFTFTTQRFHFHFFDYATFSLDSELDRQARSQFEVPGVPYQVYLTNGYTPFRETVAPASVRRTVLRVTYSRSPADSSDASLNPLLPQKSGEPKPAPASRPLKFLPPPNLSLTTHGELDVIQGQRLGLILLGETDPRAAGFAAKLLENAGMEVDFIATIRDPKTFDAAGPPEAFPERSLEDEYETYALREDYDRLIEQVDVNIHEWDARLGEPPRTTHTRVAPVDALVLVDVGGRAFVSSHAQNVSLPEHVLARAIHVGSPFRKIPGYVLTLGLGHLPSQSPTRLMNLARQYDPLPKDRKRVRKTEIAFAKRTGKITDQALNLWLQAMRQDFGPQKFPPLNKRDPLVEVRPEHAKVLLLPLDAHAIGEMTRPVRLLDLE